MPLLMCKSVPNILNLVKDIWCYKSAKIWGFLEGI